MHGWAPEVIDAVGKPEPDPDGYLRVFFAPSATSQRAGQGTLQRIFSSRSDPDEATDWPTRQHQYDAVCAWGEPNHALLQRLQRDRATGVRRQRGPRPDDPAPLLVPAGRVDPARTLKIYPDAAHGFLFQHHDEFAADVDAFLADVSAHRHGQVPT